MIIAEVIDTVVSTRKHESMQGIKLLALEECTGKSLIIAGDVLGAGVGEYVLVSCGETAVLAADREMPVDAMVVGIVDCKPQFISGEDKESRRRTT